MIRLLLTILLILTSAVAVVAQDRKPMDRKTRVFAAVAYLSSGVPEQVEAAEIIVSRDALKYFEELKTLLPEQAISGRERLLRILASTTHESRISLFVDTLCNEESVRGERIVAYGTLGDVDQKQLLADVEQRIKKEDNSDWVVLQLCNILGTISIARAQGIAEDIAESAEEDSFISFAAEDAVLRSVLASSFAQPAWSRYQKRSESAPDCTLRELRELKARLSLPHAADREDAQIEFSELIDGDQHLLLACCRSKWREEALFGLSELSGRIKKDFQLTALMVMLDIATTGEQAVALEAVSTATTLNPPTSEELIILREFTASTTMQRLETVVEQLQRGGDLTQTRKLEEILTAKLRPLLLRRGPFEERTRKLMQSLESTRQQLSYLERLWAQGWRTEFRDDILGVERE